MNHLEQKVSYEKMAKEVIDYIDSIAPGEQWSNIYYKNRWDHYRELIEHNETCVAFENLSDIISEDMELLLPNDVYVKFVNICQFFDVSPDYWKKIKYESI